MDGHTMNGHAVNGHTVASGNKAFDVIIVGAGISGINAAYRLQSQHPSLSYAVLEARAAIGGTWDLFRYPGIRSDSDLFTFGFAWHPWNQPNPIADGPSISKYMRETAASYGIDKHILFKRKVNSSSWSSDTNTWTLSVDHDGQREEFTARFVILGTGYYDYENPLPAQIPGLANFKGQVIHPQFWPEDLDYTDKNVVVIGSGATAITLMPKLAEKAKRATMLQRSPTYILSLPNPMKSSWLGRLIPNAVARVLSRIRWILSARFLFLFCRAYPNAARWVFRRRTERELPPHIPFDPHFNPRYNPWDQRMCISPDGDFFEALRSGRADVATGHIRTVTDKGIQLENGDFLPADIIVTATGLKLLVAGGAKLSVDGRPLEVSDKYLWNGVMLQDVPNLAYVIGYTNASWTLGADATAQFVCRLIDYLQQNGWTAAVPRLQDGMKLTPRRLLNLSSTYITTAEKNLPRVADAAPWQPRDNYISDYMFAKYGKITDSIEFIKGDGFRLRSKQE